MTKIERVLRAQGREARRQARERGERVIVVRPGERQPESKPGTQIILKVKP